MDHASGAEPRTDSPRWGTPDAPDSADDARRRPPRLPPGAPLLALGVPGRAQPHGLRRPDDDARRAARPGRRGRPRRVRGARAGLRADVGHRRAARRGRGDLRRGRARGRPRVRGRRGGAVLGAADACRPRRARDRHRPQLPGAGDRPARRRREVTGVALARRRLGARPRRRGAVLRPDTRLVAVNFPNNPTGACPTRDLRAHSSRCASERGVRAAQRRGLPRARARPGPAAAAGRRPVAARAVAERDEKAYGLPGLRIGWLASRDRELLARLERAQALHLDLQRGAERGAGDVALRAADRVLDRNRALIAREPAAVRRVLRRATPTASSGRRRTAAAWLPALSRRRGRRALCRELRRAGGRVLLPAEHLRVGARRRCRADRFRIGVGRRDPAPALERFDAYLAAG